MLPKITGLKLTEISLVDRPANPDAVFTCFKADKPKDEEAADKDDKPSDESDEEKGNKPKDGDKEPEAEDKDGKDDKEDDKEDEAEKSASVNLSESEIAILKAVLVKAEKQEAVAKADEPVDESVSKSDKPDDLAKAEMADALAKAQDALKKSNDALAKAQAEIEILKKQASPPKGSTKAISKAEDNGEDPLKGFQPIVKNDGSLDDVATLIKAAQTGRL